MRVNDIVLIAICAALTAVGASLAIPLPGGVPFTLQVLFVLLTGGLLGPWKGALSQVVYLLIGAIGVPVFAGFTAGPGVLLGPTGGFLAGFVVAAAVTGLLAGDPGRRGPSARTGYWRILLAMLAGLAAIYAAGALRLAAFLPGGAAEAVRRGILPFLVPDVLKAVLAAALVHRLGRRLGRARLRS